MLNDSRIWGTHLKRREVVMVVYFEFECMVVLKKVMKIITGYFTTHKSFEEYFAY